MIKDIKMDRYLNLSDWKLVNELVGQNALQEKVAEQEHLNFRRSQIDNGNRNSYINFEDEDVLAETRSRIINILRKMFWEKYNQS